MVTPEWELTQLHWGAGSPLASGGWADAAPGPEGWLVAYLRHEIGGPVRLVLARLEADATLVDTSPPLAASDSTIRGPVAVSRGADAWLVVWPMGVGTAARARATLVTNEGVAVTPGGFELPMLGVDDVAVAWDGEGWTVVANTGKGISVGGGAVRVLPTGTMSDLTSIDLVGQGPPVITRGHEGLLVASAAKDGTIRLHRVAPGTNGAPHELSVNTIDAKVGGDQRMAAAWNGTEYLLAWPDTRAGYFNETFYGTPTTASTDLYATRLSVDGTVVDPPPLGIGLVGFVVSEKAFDQDSPRVVASGLETWPGASTAPGDFFLVWRSSENAAQPLYCKWTFDDECTKSDVYGAVVDLGLVQPAGGHVLVDSDIRANRPLVVEGTNGHAALLWGDGGPDLSWTSDTFACLLDEAPVLDDATPVTVVSASPSEQRHVALASGPTGWLAVLTENRGAPGAIEVRAVRLGSDGKTLEPEGTLLGVTRGEDFEVGPYTAVAYVGAAWVVAWVQDAQAPSPSDSPPGRLKVRRLLDDGSDLGEFDVGPGVSVGQLTYRFNPALATSGDGALLVYNDVAAMPEHTGRYLMLDASGEAIVGAEGSVGTLTFGHSTHAAAWDGNRYLVASAQYDASVATRLIEEDGSTASPATGLVLAAPGNPTQIAAAAAPWGWLIAWSDPIVWNEDVRIHVARLDPNGAMLDIDAGWTPPMSRLGTPALATHPGGLPMMAWVDGASFLVKGVRFGSDGLPMEAPLVLSTADMPAAEVVLETHSTEVWALLTSRTAPYGNLDAPILSQRASLRWVDPDGVLEPSGDIAEPEDVTAEPEDVTAEPEDDTAEPEDDTAEETKADSSADVGSRDDELTEARETEDALPSSDSHGEFASPDDVHVPSSPIPDDGGCASAPQSGRGGLWLIFWCVAAGTFRRRRNNGPEQREQHTGASFARPSAA